MPGVKGLIMLRGVAAVVLGVSVATAANDEASPDKTDAPGEDTSYSHFFQFGVRASLVGGYRMVFRYDESPLCTEDDVVNGRPVARDDQQKMCGHVGPLAVDLGLSFAPLGPIEPFLWGRFGLTGESQTNTTPVKIIGVGTRIYASSDSALKIYIEPAIGYEMESGGDNPAWDQYEYKRDMVFHLGVGPQIDLARGFGLFFNGGITVGVLRAIHASLELQGGLQARFP